MVVRALAKQGIKADSVHGTAPISQTAVRAALGGNETDRILSITLHDWLFDVCPTRTIQFRYDVHVVVTDRDGAKLGETRQKGCGGAVRDPWKFPEWQIAETYRVVLERALSDPAISAAISMPKLAPRQPRGRDPRR